jgi:hypothetical protein
MNKDTICAFGGLDFDTLGPVERAYYLIAKRNARSFNLRLSIPQHLDHTRPRIISLEQLDDHPLRHVNHNKRGQNA